VVYPGITTDVDDALVLLLTAISDNANDSENLSGYANAGLASTAEHFDQAETQGSGGGLGVASGVKTSAGGTGDSTATHDNAVDAVSVHLAIYPATGGGGEEHQIAAALSLGLTMAVALVRAHPLAANLSLANAATATILLDHRIAAALTPTLTMAAALQQEFMLAAALSMGYASTAALLQEHMVAAAFSPALGITANLTLSQVLQIAASMDLGLAMAAGLTQEQFIAAQLALSLAMAVNITRVRAGVLILTPLEEELL
jgi:hypothetical protein